MKAGDKVVCLYDGWRYNGPTKGEIVTIFNVLNCFGYSFVELDEYTNTFENGKRVDFNSRHFVPLQYWQQAEYMTEELIQETLMPVEI